MSRLVVARCWAGCTVIHHGFRGWIVNWLLQEYLGHGKLSSDHDEQPWIWILDPFVSSKLKTLNLLMTRYGPSKLRISFRQIPFFSCRLCSHSFVLILAHRVVVVVLLVITAELNVCMNLLHLFNEFCGILYLTAVLGWFELANRPPPPKVGIQGVSV